jgi:hypothetical protein
MGDTPAEVESLVIDGLHIQDSGNAAQTRPYIRVSGHVRHLVVKNSEIFCASDKQAVFIAIKGEQAKIDRLTMYNLCTENMAELVSDPDKKIGRLEVDHIATNKPA